MSGESIPRIEPGSRAYNRKLSRLLEDVKTETDGWKAKCPFCANNTLYLPHEGGAYCKSDTCGGQELYETISQLVEDYFQQPNLFTEAAVSAVSECLLPAPYAVPEPDEPVLTARAVLEALQVRMVQDLDKAREAIQKQKSYEVTGWNYREHHLEHALLVIGEYWGRELCNRLDLKPADKATL